MKHDKQRKFKIPEASKNWLIIALSLMLLVTTVINKPKTVSETIQVISVVDAVESLQCVTNTEIKEL